AAFTLERMTGYPIVSMAFSISSMETASASKLVRTLLELNSTSTLSFSTPATPFTAFSIFCKQDGQDNVSKWITAFCIVNLSFLYLNKKSFPYLYFQYNETFQITN